MQIGREKLKSTYLLRIQNFSCTRFLNNIHLSDLMYSVTVVNMIRYGEVSKGKEHIVLELLCCQQDASAEHLISKFTSENLKS